MRTGKPASLQTMSSRPVGIDVGIRSRITCSNGFKTGRNELDRSELKRRQRILSKAKKGSDSRKKKRMAYAKESQRVSIAVMRQTGI